MRTLRSTTVALILILAIACGSSNFATSLQAVLAASGPLIDSLNLGDKREALITDFADLASGAATLATDLQACAKDKACSLSAINKFQVRFWDIERRGHFKLSPKLEKVQGILAGIIAAAKIYFAPAAAGRQASKPVTDADLKAKLAELKTAMQP